MYAVIMAGGSGTRFWPASREHLPKQFLKITGDRTMLEETVARIEHFTGQDRIFVVAGQVHAHITRQLLEGTEVKVLFEPRGRNTAACIGLAALHIAKISPHEPMIVLPADHYISNLEEFTATVRAAAELARSGGIMTLGIPPTRPETGYGYIQTAEARGQSQGSAFYAVECFVEKPDHQTALKYLSSGNYLWNSGIFVFTPQTILREIELCLPELHEGLLQIQAAIDTDDYDAIVERVYEKIPSISIDFGVIEKTSAPIFVFKAGFGWSDVGSWQALYELRAPEYDANGNLLLGSGMPVDSRDNLVYSTTERRVALLGVAGLVIVDTPDMLMVADLKRSQDVKVFTEMLK